MKKNTIKKSINSSEQEFNADDLHLISKLPPFSHFVRMIIFPSPLSSSASSSSLPGMSSA